MCAFISPSNHLCNTMSLHSIIQDGLGVLVWCRGPWVFIKSILSWKQEGYIQLSQRPPTLLNQVFTILPPQSKAQWMFHSDSLI